LELIVTYMPSQHDPCKSPDWRWERARYLRETRYVHNREDDAYTLAAKNFQALESYAKTERNRLALARKYPGIFWARHIHQDQNDLQSDARWAIEAYLLSRATPKQIAEFCSTDVDTVIWYEKLFFNVWPYLKSDTYIVNVVMGRSVHHGITEREHDLFWKMVGYAFGHIYLRDFIRPIRPQLVRGDDQIDQATDGWVNRQLRKKAAVAIQTLPVYNNQGIILEAWNRAKEIAQLGGNNNVESQIVANVGAALGCLPFVVGRQGQLHLPTLAHYDSHGVELRAHEQMQVALGHETETHKKAITWKFPEPPTATSQTAVS
jgi:hypothetical protein